MKKLTKKSIRISLLPKTDLEVLCLNTAHGNKRLKITVIEKGRVAAIFYPTEIRIERDRAVFGKAKILLTPPRRESICRWLAESSGLEQTHFHPYTYVCNTSD